jgi:hypothetical protein
MYVWLDRAPLGRDETGVWWRRHDEYEDGCAAATSSDVKQVRKPIRNREGRSPRRG